MKSPTQSDLAFQGLKRSILECQLLPASKIKINDVCAEYEVSLGAAREALSRLAAEGMVQMESQKGFSVASISWQEFAELTEARVTIETFCLDQAISHGDVEWESQVAGALHRLSRLPERDEDDGRLPGAAWLAAHTEFHRALVTACPNRCMLDLRQMLFVRSERYRHWAVSLCLVRGQRDAHQEHEAIVEAALARDSRLACARIQEHLQRTADDLLDTAREQRGNGTIVTPPYRRRIPA